MDEKVMYLSELLSSTKIEINKSQFDKWIDVFKQIVADLEKNNSLDYPTKQIENKSFDEKVKDFMNVGDDLQEAIYHAHDIEMYEFFKDKIETKLLPENNTTNT